MVRPVALWPLWAQIIRCAECAPGGGDPALCDIHYRLVLAWQREGVDPNGPAD